MNVGEGSLEDNPTHSYLNSKGIWLTYLIIIWIGHFLILSLPFVSVAVAWTMTNVIHDVALYMMLHVTKGTPWLSADQGESRRETQWEQIDRGRQFTATKKFLTTVPIILFFLASFYTKYDKVHFALNASCLLLNLLPKMPQFHGVRIFGINKY